MYLNLALTSNLFTFFSQLTDLSRLIKIYLICHAEQLEINKKIVKASIIKIV